ncbi:MAG TPA: hypothetical protein VHZ31_02950 [Solirubrobacteraceae bacterium]|jgi:hypothetical protein|nr:hypothetical protein [Solirubrobacteraceae bacterium]
MSQPVEPPDSPAQAPPSTSGVTKASSAEAVAKAEDHLANVDMKSQREALARLSRKM